MNFFRYTPPPFYFLLCLVLGRATRILRNIKTQNVVVLIFLNIKLHLIHSWLDSVICRDSIERRLRMPKKINFEEKEIVEMYERGMECFKKDGTKNTELVNHLRDLFTLEGLDEDVHKIDMDLSVFCKISRTLALLVESPLAYLIVRIFPNKVTLKFQVDLDRVENATRYRLNNTYNLNLPMLKSTKSDIDF